MAGGIGGLPSFGPGDAQTGSGACVRARCHRAFGTCPPSGPPARVRRREPPVYPRFVATEESMSHAGIEPTAIVPFPRGRVLRELPVAERPRERLELRGPGGLTSAELVGLLWGSGSRGRSSVDLSRGSAAQRPPSSRLRSSSDGGSSPTGRLLVGRSAHRVTSRTASSFRWVDWSARSCASSS
ncbi:MAG: hypothetical protein HW391_2004 [Chloroflexi bacterium]|nr:hypothetical protein [Chloroflexota bacterium]